MNKKMLAGMAMVLPALAWAGTEVWAALQEAGKIPAIEARLAEHDRADERLATEIREMRRLTMEMLMLQHREFGDERRAQELKSELAKLKEVK